MPPRRRTDDKSKSLGERLASVITADELAEVLGIRNWTHLLIGDGSGTRAHLPCGFASVLIDCRRPAAWSIYHGSLSCGSNITAELMAYLSPMLALTHEPDQGSRRIHILTDCEFLYQASTRAGYRRKHAPIWAALSLAARMISAQVTWHWVPRDCLRQNQLSHELANQARRAAAKINAEQAATQDALATHAQRRADRRAAQRQEANG